MKRFMIIAELLIHPHVNLRLKECSHKPSSLERPTLNLNLTYDGLMMTATFPTLIKTTLSRTDLPFH